MPSAMMRVIFSMVESISMERADIVHADLYMH
jgi:hypothetical protein